MRFNNIQVLRLVASVGVVVYHLGVYTRAEFGVDGPAWELVRLPGLAPAFVPLFFAVSGFVLTHALRASSAPRFLLNRAVRLYPGYWLALAAVTTVVAAGLWPGRYLATASPAPSVETVLLTPPTALRLGQYPLMIEWTLIYELFLGAALVGLRAVVGPRGLPYAAAGWLAVLAAKSVLWPGLGSTAIPSWRTIGVSVYVAPFLAGVLVYTLAGRWRGWRWPVAAAAAGLQLVAAVWVPFEATDPHQWLRAVAAGMTVWFLVQVPDARPTNPLVVGGGYSYGLYLVHVPLILLSFRLMQAANLLVATSTGAALAGAVAVSGGLLFGRVELGLYDRLKRSADRLVAAVGRSWGGRGRRTLLPVAVRR
ncbi:MAG: acyltransferase [Gemmataceae bacterium]